MKGIVITTDGTASIQDFGEPLWKTAGKAVGGYIEHVNPMLLPEPYCMIVNEEGRLIWLPTNPTGSILYGYAEHGVDIRGQIVLMKDGYTDEGPDIIGLEDSDINFLAELLADLTDGIVTVPEK